MPLRLKTKFTLTTAVLVSSAAVFIAAIYTARLTREQIDDVDKTAHYVAETLLRRSSDALKEAADKGAAPASESPADIRTFVQQVLRDDPITEQQIEWGLSFFPAIYEVTFVDPEGIVLLSSDVRLVNQPAVKRQNFSKLAASSFFEQLKEMRGPQRVYEVSVPFRLGEGSGEVRIGLSTALLRESILQGLRSAFLLALAAVVISTFTAAVISNAALAPLDRISAQLDTIAQEAAGTALPAPASAAAGPPEGDELRVVSSKVTRIGEQLRGVREIFSTLHENLNRVMAGLDDGLILFGADGRAVLASPAVEKFLGVKPESLLGKPAREVFPKEHALGRALPFENQNLSAMETCEVELDADDPGGEAANSATRGATVRRAVASVQLIHANAASDKQRPMGALLTLRDLESIERLGS